MGLPVLMKTLFAFPACVLMLGLFDGHGQNSKASADSATIDRYLTELSAERNFSGGLLIVHRGKKIFSKAYGWADKAKSLRFTPTTLASLGSMSKSFTATAIMKLVEEGRLSLDDNLGKFFPGIPNDKAGITIHQLLTHSSGLAEFLEGNPNDYAKIDKREFIERVYKEGLIFKPGTKGRYSNTGMSLLAVIVEEITKTDFGSYLEKMLQPGGIKHVGFHYPLKKTGAIAHGYQGGIDWGTHQTHYDQAGGGPYWILKGNGGLEASMDDIFQWILSFTNNSILKKQTLDQMFTPYLGEEESDHRYSFGYGFVLSKTRTGAKAVETSGSNGVYFARLTFLPEENLGFFMITNESTMNANMVLPNVRQLYLYGEIREDATMPASQFEFPLAQRIYSIINTSNALDLDTELKKENISVDDDMVLLEVGRKLISESKTAKATVLYKYYTQTFPNIVVAWNDLGDLYLISGDKDEAVKCYKKVISINRNPRETIRARQSLEKLGRSHD